MRRVAPLFAIVAALMLSTSPVLAGGKPIRTLIDQGGLSFTLPAPDFCAADVQVTVVINREYLKVFPVDADGSQRVLTNGSLVVQLTNLATSKTLLVNVSGPSVATFQADGSAAIIGKGPSLVFFPGQGIHLDDGQVDFISGALLHGRSIDMCAALGA